MNVISQGNYGRGWVVMVKVFLFLSHKSSQLGILASAHLNNAVEILFY